MARYQAGSYDLDGKEYVTGSNISEIQYIALTGSSFYEPTVYSHWGAAADGQFYAAGIPCGFGPLALSASALNPQAWRYANIDPFASGLCGFGSIQALATNQVRFATTSNIPASEDLQMDSLYKWFIGGSLDTQIDFANFTLSSGPGLSFRFQLIYRMGSSGLCAAVVTRTHDGIVGDDYTAYTLNNGSILNFQRAFAPAGAVGSLRITRTSLTLSFFYKQGGPWIQIGSNVSASGNIEDGACFARLVLYGNASQGSVDASNIAATSGALLNTAGWYREAPNAHRGFSPSFPSECLLLTTQDSLSIIDVSNADPVHHKLWLRPIRSTSSALPVAATSRPLRTAWGNGRLLIAQGDMPPAANEYGAVLFDFLKDEVLIARTPDGLRFAPTAPYATGAIAMRNSPEGTIPISNPEYFLKSCRVRDVAFFLESGWEYRAFALADSSYGGIAIYGEERGSTLQVPGYARSSVSTVMRCVQFSSSGELFYVDGATIYSLDKADWIAALLASSQPGLFSYSHTKALPGTRTIDGLYRVVLNGASLYAISATGVYFMEWPSGDFVLRYGTLSSSAQYPILPEALQLSSFSGLVFNSDFHLILSGTVGAAGYLYFINTEWHALTDTLNVTSAIGAPVSAISKV